MKNILFTIWLLFSINLKALAQQPSGTDSVPVRINYFTTVQYNNQTRLNWKVVCNLDHANFEIQRSTNGFDYTTINSFSANRLRCLSPFNYDDAIFPTRTFYRLKVGDKDGNYSNSKVLVTFGKENSFEINSIVPNLVTTSTLIRISAAENGKADIFITNFQGVVAKRFNINLNKGVSEVKMDLTDLPKGIYIIKVINSLSDVRFSKIVKQ